MIVLLYINLGHMYKLCYLNLHFIFSNTQDKQLNKQVNVTM